MSRNGSVRSLLFLLLLTVPSAAAIESSLATRSTAAGQSGSFDLRGEDIGDHFGGNLATGDVNGDGVLDLAVGAFGVGLGRAYLFYGPVTSNLRASAADVTVSSAPPFRSLDPVAIGDLDNDGFDDLIVAAHRADTNGPLAGEAYVFYGPLTGDLTPLDADATITGGAFDELGRQLVTGDFNGDGFDDLVAASNVAGSTFAGMAWLFFGPIQGEHSADDADIVFTGRFFSESFGSSVTVGDANGDGLDDLFIGAEQFPLVVNGPGHAFLYLAPLTTGVLSSNFADAVLTGEDVNDAFGSSVAIAGDLNGDGFADLVVGAREEFNGGEGRAYVFHGPVAGNVFASEADGVIVGESAGDFFGRSASAAGDLDGDGFDDILVGAMFAHPNLRGSAYVFHGPLTGTIPAANAARIFEGDGANDRMGLTLLGDVDLDGDTKPDMLLGAPGFVGAGTMTRGFVRGVLGR